uniref:Ycf34 n=1 Tax=Chondria sp. (in: red algae) TaxID=1982705 RepID=A0A1Z1MR94_9FLOR|nr:hypothetical protein [Chondria sp. (in: red algae)]
MCICINCRHIHYCLTYEFINKQHNRQFKYMTNNLNFAPINTVINVNLSRRQSLIYIDWDLIECLSFVEKPGYWLVQRKNHIIAS